MSAEQKGRADVRSGSSAACSRHPEWDEFDRRMERYDRIARWCYIVAWGLAMFLVGFEVGYGV